MPDSPTDTSSDFAAQSQQDAPESETPAFTWEQLSEQLGAELSKSALEFLARSSPTRELWQLLSQ